MDNKRDEIDITFSALTENIDDGTELKVVITPLDLNQKKFKTNEGIKILKTEGIVSNNKVKYTFTLKSLFEELKIAVKDIKYIEGVIDANNDGEIDNNDTTTLYKVGPVFKSEEYKGKESIYINIKSLNSMKKSYIKVLQESLFKFNIKSVGSADGEIGKKTQGAIITFKQKYNREEHYKTEKLKKSKNSKDTKTHYEEHGLTSKTDYKKEDLDKIVIDFNFFMAIDEALFTEWEYKVNCKLQIDHEFINKFEGVEKEGYVPDSKGSKSGVTIANGFDLGARNENDLKILGFPETLRDKLKPYLGLKKDEAVKFLKENPLSITDDELKIIVEKVKNSETTKIVNYYNNSSSKVKFECLPREAQTVIASVAYQLGSNLKHEKVAPDFWGQAITQDWKAMLKNLRDFGDIYPTRRNKEADLLEKILDIEKKD